ncbi:receptor-like protein 13 isoform X13 [Citrus sinensis]|uniref:receptor-like protein 13 isoform X13 n=1 Tax=Citrus sinensis TaxID=2711 RepID=UPI0022788BF0|nr:receptor-like protein 13 isoform X13 [Citrus sinensis]
MGGSKSKMVVMFVLLLIIFEGGWSEGCLNHERFALLQLKLFFIDPYNYLLDWVDDEGATDCCQWERVSCNNTMGRVVVLDLSQTHRGEYWYLNASLFTPFQQLESLDLRDNDIAGCVENEGLERLSRLSNLKMLNLVGNLFNNSILSSLARLSSLTSLDLSANRLKGSIDIKELDSLRDLEKLNIGRNMIDKFVVSKGPKRLSRLNNLKVFDLSGNLFNNSILSSLARLSSLRSLLLYDNRLEGSIDVKEFDSLSNLEELDMSYNEIDNFEVPQGYKGLRRLKSLDLSEVEIRDGSKLLQSMGSFPSLNTLDLSYNNFTDIATATQELHNFTNLEYLTLDYSSLHISLLQSIASFTSLKNLSMSYCEVNGVLSGQGLERLTNLKMLDLRGNLFNNSILSSLARLSSLTSLDLSYNRLEGSINVKEFDSLSNLEELDMSGNEIDNFEVPQGYKGLRKLKTLYLLGVGIRDGSKLLQSMGSFPSLNNLDLSYNNFTDTVTTTQELHNFANLEYLALDFSSLHTSLLQSIASFTSLKKLSMTNCEVNGVLSGQALETLSRLTNLKMLDLRGNLFNNSILSSLAHLSSLTSLDLSENKLEGSINVKEFDSLSNLEELDMSGNEIDNFQVPQGYGGLRKLKSLYLSSVGIRDGSKLLRSMGSFPSLNTLYLWGNNFTETMTTTTQELHNFTNLEYLTLDYSSLHISLLQSIASISPSLKNLSMCGCELNGVVRGQGFPHFKSLEHLEMDDARIALNTSFLQIIGELMPSLKYLSLSYSTPGTNSIGILDQGLCSLVHLQVLYIDNNDLRGSLPWCMANMTSLRILHVYSNQLTGSISSSPLVHLTSIEALMLSDNHFQIPISLEPLFNHSRLKIFYADNNELNAEITESHSLTAPNFQLSRLSLSSSYGDGFIFPKFLYHQHDLELVDLSHIKMNGEFPTWLLETTQN